jgi:tetratricopeptide (TPR) repeat protein
LKLSEGFLAEESYLREILDLLSWSGSAPMSSDLILTVLAISDSASLVGALSLGTELRLLQRSSEADSYSLHRLVGEVRRGEIPLEERIDWVKAICNRLGSWFQSKREDFTKLTMFEAEIDHLRTWQQNSTRFAPSSSSRLMWLQGYPAYHRGRFIEARNYVLEAKRVFDELNETDDELEAHLINDIGSTDFALGDFRSALADHLKALEIRRALFGETHADVAHSLDNVSSSFANLGNLNEAVSYGEQALHLRRKLFGKFHPDIATSLARISTYYGELGDRRRALQYSEEALIMRRELFVEPHPDIANSIADLGFWYHEHGNYTRALEYAELALTMRRELYGELHPYVAQSLRSVGSCYIQTGDLNRGLEYSERSLAMKRDLFGERHPDFAVSLITIGHAHRQLGNVELALNYYQKALAIIVSCLVPNINILPQRSTT